VLQKIPAIFMQAGSSESGDSTLRGYSKQPSYELILRPNISLLLEMGTRPFIKSILVVVVDVV